MSGLLDSYWEWRTTRSVYTRMRDHYREVMGEEPSVVADALLHSFAEAFDAMGASLYGS